MKSWFLIISAFLVLISPSCSSKIDKWEKDLEICITKTDSVQYLLKTTLGDEQLEEELLEAEVLWNQLKLKFEDSNDTLTKEQMEILDDFNVAFHNARNLNKERLKCLIATSKQRLRLQRLENDIKLGNGKRSEYCENVQHEKEELTIIETHAKDIHRRFEELKRSKTQFNENFAL